MNYLTGLITLPLLLWLAAEFLLGSANVQANSGKPDLAKGITRIAFGSCVHQDHEQPIWKALNIEHPDLFVFLGDNIYGDTEDMAELQRKYQKLGAPRFSNPAPTEPCASYLG